MGQHRRVRGRALAKYLLVGFFSTVGDIECLNVVRDALDAKGIGYDVAAYSRGIGRSLAGSLDLRSVVPGDYAGLMVICGPCWPGIFRQFGLDIDAFAGRRRIGVNLTMIEPLTSWNPFHVLLGRDADEIARADLSFAGPSDRSDVVGLCVVGRQPEYGTRQRLDRSTAQLVALLARKGAARVDIDTRWPEQRNRSRLRNGQEVLALMGRMDVVLTNRLHGLVFALRSGTPAVVIDGIAGGGKVTAQAKALGWPAIAGAATVTDNQLDELYDWCRSTEARSTVEAVAVQARRSLEAFNDDLYAAMHDKVVDRPVPKEPAPPLQLTLRRVARRIIGFGR